MRAWRCRFRAAPVRRLAMRARMTLRRKTPRTGRPSRVARKSSQSDEGAGAAREIRDRLPGSRPTARGALGTPQSPALRYNPRDAAPQKDGRSTRVQPPHAEDVKLPMHVHHSTVTDFARLRG